MAAVLGMVSGIGGGIMRDILAGDILGILRSDLYTLAALAAAAIVSVVEVLGIAPLYTMPLGAAVCIFLRIMRCTVAGGSPSPTGAAAKAGADDRFRCLGYPRRNVLERTLAWQDHAGEGSR